MDAKIKAHQTRAEKRLEILRKGGKAPYMRLRPGRWEELLPGIQVMLVQSTMHGAEIDVDVR